MSAFKSTTEHISPSCAQVSQDSKQRYQKQNKYFIREKRPSLQAVTDSKLRNQQLQKELKNSITNLAKGSFDPWLIQEDSVNGNT